MQNVDMESISEKAKFWISKLIRLRSFGLSPDERLPLSHASISERTWNSTDTQGRSFLSSFERLMRHVWIWERACDGDIVLDNMTFASVNYAEASCPVGYDETPHYAWNESFEFATFENTILGVNENERTQLQRNMSDCGYTAEGWRKRTNRPRFTELIKDSDKIRRIVIGKSLEDVLSDAGDTHIPLWIPENFASFANETIAKALVTHSLPANTQALYSALKDPLDDSEVGGDLRPYYWRIDHLCAWQKIDRRIDEIYEVLWAFHSANAVLIAEKQERLALFITHLSKRAIRKGPDDEMASFARWIGRVPNVFSFSYSENWYDMPFDDEDEDLLWEW